MIPRSVKTEFCFLSWRWRKPLLLADWAWQIRLVPGDSSLAGTQKTPRAPSVCLGLHRELLVAHTLDVRGPRVESGCRVRAPKVNCAITEPSGSKSAETNKPPLSMVQVVYFFLVGANVMPCKNLVTFAGAVS